MFGQHPPGKNAEFSVSRVSAQVYPRGKKKTLENETDLEIVYLTSHSQTGNKTPFNSLVTRTGKVHPLKLTAAPHPSPTEWTVSVGQESPAQRRTPGPPAPASIPTMTSPATDSLLGASADSQLGQWVLLLLLFLSGVSPWGPRRALYVCWFLEFSWSRLWKPISFSTD